MKIKNMAQYKNESKIGVIRLSKLTGKKPIEYTLQLFENVSIHLNKNKFPTIASAIAQATLYGFIPDLWTIEEMEY